MKGKHSTASLCALSVFLFLAAQHVGSQFSDQGSNLHPLQWKNGILTTGPLGKSQEIPTLLNPPCNRCFHLTEDTGQSWLLSPSCCPSSWTTFPLSSNTSSPKSGFRLCSLFYPHLSHDFIALNTTGMLALPKFTCLALTFSFSSRFLYLTALSTLLLGCLIS